MDDNKEEKKAELVAKAVASGRPVEGDDTDELAEGLDRDAIARAGDEFLAGVAKGVKGKPGSKAKAAGADDDADADDADEDEDEDADDRDGEGDEADDADDKKKAASKDDADDDADDEEEEEDDDEEQEGKDASSKKKADDKLTTFTLKGHEERGEEDIELVVEDPAAMERLKRLSADAMRGRDYRERVSQIEEREAELEEAELVIEQSPLKFILETMDQGRRLEVAKALLAEHFDELTPVIEEYLDDKAKPTKDQLAARKKADEDEKELARMRTARAQAREYRRKVEELIPEGIATQTHARFLRDAQRDILDAVQRGERVSPADVPRLLAERIRLYGFTVSKKDRSGNGTAVARPASRRASEIADRKAEADRFQKKLKRVQAARKQGKAIVPGGRGTATTVQKLVKDSATVEEAGEALLRSGKASSWDSLNGKGAS